MKGSVRLLPVLILHVCSHLIMQERAPSARVTLPRLHSARDTAEISTENLLVGVSRTACIITAGGWGAAWPIGGRREAWVGGWVGVSMISPRTDSPCFTSMHGAAPASCNRAFIIATYLIHAPDTLE